MSSFKQGKYFFEDLFLVNWTQTPIHFAGQDFDGNGIPEWINVVFTPYQSANNGIGSQVKKLYATVTVTGWAENDVNVMQLGDQISAFVDEGVLNSEYTIKQTNLLDHGWDESGKAYLITQFTVEFYAGVC